MIKSKKGMTDVITKEAIDPKKNFDFQKFELIYNEGIKDWKKVMESNKDLSLTVY
jgi:hypothetical protein